ncbi:MAG: hypothetical protein RL653_342 [Pseudomonadota bacterium]|jgi:ABC-type nitrate/sulfonate/bicarbonate transport system substrate-binding protein
MEKLHVRFLRYSAFYTPLLLTLEGDSLRRAGISATFDKVEPGKTIDEGFRDGTVTVAQSAPAVSFQPALKGTPPPYRHFSVMNVRDGFFLAGRDTATPFAWASLEGRTVLVDHFFQPLALFRTALRARGVDEAKVRVVDAGDVSRMEAAFRAGEGDFLHAQGPVPQQLECEKAARVVASVGEAAGPLAFSSLCARPEWLTTDVARAFLRVYRAARAEAHAAPVADVVRRITAFLPGVSPEALAATVDAYQRLGTWAGDDTFTVPLFERTVDIFLAVGHISARPAFEDVAAAAAAT